MVLPHFLRVSLITLILVHELVDRAVVSLLVIHVKIRIPFGVSLSESLFVRYICHTLIDFVLGKGK